MKEREKLFSDNQCPATELFYLNKFKSYAHRIKFYAHRILEYALCPADKSGCIY